MKKYPLVSLAIVLVVTLTVVTAWLREGPGDLQSSADVASPAVAGETRPPAKRTGVSPTPAAAEPLESLDLAGSLNHPGRTIDEDLRELDGVFSVWQTNFLGAGNPVGENAEITAALTGANRLRLAFIAPGHPAIDEQGQLCDRWGTPFFFHQLDGFRMEIISAGPDRRRGTADDRRLSPPSVE